MVKVDDATEEAVCAWLGKKSDLDDLLEKMLELALELLFDPVSMISALDLNVHVTGLLWRSAAFNDGSVLDRLSQGESPDGSLNSLLMSLIRGPTFTSASSSLVLDLPNNAGNFPTSSLTSDPRYEDSDDNDLPKSMSMPEKFGGTTLLSGTRC